MSLFCPLPSPSSHLHPPHFLFCFSCQLLKTVILKLHWLFQSQEECASARGFFHKEIIPVFWFFLARNNKNKPWDRPVRLCSSYSNSFERLRRGGGGGSRFTPPDRCLMRFVLHLFRCFSWFLCCPWKDFESHHSVSLSSSAIPAPCLNGTHTMRKERRMFPASRLSNF